MNLTMNSVLPSHCLTSNCAFTTVNGIQSKLEASRLINSISFSLKYSKSRFKKIQLRDQVRAVRLIKKVLPGLPSRPKRQIQLTEHAYKGSSNFRLQGYTATPERSSLAQPAPGFHLEIQGCHSDVSCRIELTISKDNETWHDLLHSEEVFSDPGWNNSMDNGIARAKDVLSDFNISVNYDS